MFCCWPREGASSPVCPLFWALNIAQSTVLCWVLSPSIHNSTDWRVVCWVGWFDKGSCLAVLRTYSCCVLRGHFLESSRTIWGTGVQRGVFYCTVSAAHAREFQRERGVWLKAMSYVSVERNRVHHRKTFLGFFSLALNTSTSGARPEPVSWVFFGKHFSTLPFQQPSMGLEEPDSSPTACLSPLSPE